MPVPGITDAGTDNQFSIWVLCMQKVLKAGYLLIILGLVGCAGAGGAIKTFEESEVKDKNRIAVLYLPPAVELLEADGIEYDTPFIETGHNEVHLLPGKHVLAVKYVQFWGNEVSGNMVYSDPILFNLDVEGTETIYLNYERPKDIWAAQAIAKRFSPWLEDASGNKLAVKGSQFFSGSLTMTSSAAGSAKAIASKEPLSELKFWWERATYDEREAFKKWLEAE